MKHPALAPAISDFFYHAYIEEKTHFNGPGSGSGHFMCGGRLLPGSLKKCYELNLQKTTDDWFIGFILCFFFKRQPWQLGAQCYEKTTADAGVLSPSSCSPGCGRGSTWGRPAHPRIWGHRAQPSPQMECASSEVLNTFQISNKCGNIQQLRYTINRSSSSKLK